jgi:beta-galactosidase
LNWFGAAYYPEHWPQERWKEDARTMAYLGMNVVRIGEFSWSTVEKTPGDIDFSLLDEAIEVIYSEGIRVIMGTPTCTPPSWLIKRSPDILQVDRDGLTISAGSRRHYCFNSPVYREETIRIVKSYVEHYGRDPRVIAWQADNEYGCHNSTVCYCDNCARAFREWLKKRYGTLERLNQSWGTVFWSQVYLDWEEIAPPRRSLSSPNPALMLDYRRFSSDSALEYHILQRDVVKKGSRAPLTHNFMVNFTEIDYRKIAEKIDFVSWDNYIMSDYDPDLQALNHDLMRSLKKAPFLVMEQQPGRVNWRVVNDTYPAEQMTFWIKQSMAHGAFGSLIFRFRQLPFGAEQFHGGLLNYDGSITERARAFAETVKELRNWKVEGLKKEAAIYVDYENFWIGETDNLNGSFNLLQDGILPLYKTIRSFGYNVDFLFPGDSLSGYSFVCVPSAFKIDADFLESLLAFEGKIFITAMTSQKDENNNIRLQGKDSFERLTGIRVFDAAGIKKPIRISCGKDECTGGFVVEAIEMADGCEEIATYLEGPFKGRPAIVKKDSCYYISTVADIETFKWLFQSAGIQRVADGSARVLRTQSNMVLLNPYPYNIRIRIDGVVYDLREYEVKVI